LTFAHCGLQRVSRDIEWNTTDLLREGQEADRLILSAENKNKALWKIMNKETGNSQRAPNIIINTENKLIRNPQIIREKFNIYFTEVIEGLLSQVNYRCPQQHSKFHIKNCSETMFVAPL
jgi:hypothetical protein